MTPRIVLCLLGNHYSISVLNCPLLPLVVYLGRTTSKKKRGKQKKKDFLIVPFCLGVKMYFFISTLNKQLCAFVICLFIYHDNQRGENNQLSQGLDVTIESAVHLPSCFTDVTNPNDPSRNKFQAVCVSYLVWIKEDHIATKTLLDLPCLSPGFISLHFTTLAFLPSFQ